MPKASKDPAKIDFYLTDPIAKVENKQGPVKVAHATTVTTSTFKKFINEETEQVQGTGAKYNPDLDPYQPPLLKRSDVDVGSQSFREALLDESQFLQSHTFDVLRKIVLDGWTLIKKGIDADKLRKVYQNILTTEYANAINTPLEHAVKLEQEEEGDLDYDPAKDPNNIVENSPDWDKVLEQAFIEAIAKACVVNTSFICAFAETPTPTEENVEREKAVLDFRVFTSNDVYRVYGNNNRRITEVYFIYPALPELRREDTGSTYVNQIIGYLTQYAPVKDRPPTNNIAQILEENNNALELAKTVTRNCIVIQPYRYPKLVYGKDLFRPLVKTALAKEYLRFYELLFVHKGGVNRTVGFQQGLDKDIKDNIIAETRRGMLSRGTVMGSSSGKPISEQLLVVETQIPDLKFDTVNSHLSEDSKLTKQGVEGEAASGALGGSAPEVNAQEDTEYTKQLYTICEQAIKDINFTYFDLDPQTYDVYFTKPYQPIDQKTIENVRTIQPANADGEKPKTEEANSIKFQNGEFTEAIAHSMTEEFNVYEGNLFHAGVYHYREKGIDRIFTPDDIRHLTQRNVRSGYLEIDHSFDERNVGLSEGVGYFEIKGYDEIGKKDITHFFIKKKYASLVDPVRIKISPYFHLDESSSLKEIYIKNAAVVVKGMPRSEDSGLKTEAMRIK
jgi:hypothetical protein